VLLWILRKGWYRFLRIPIMAFVLVLFAFALVGPHVYPSWISEVDLIIIVILTVSVVWLYLS